MIRKSRNIKAITRPANKKDIDQKIVIGFVGYNCWNLTKNAINSIVSNCKDVNVVYVDNGSTQENIWEAQAYNQPNKFIDDYQTIFRKENCVAGAWNNILQVGIDTDADKILICNNDILFASCTIDNLVEAFDRIKAKDPRTVLVSASNRMRDPTKLEDAVPIWEDDPPEHPDFSCFMISEDWMGRLGYFDEFYKPAFFEDNHHHWKILLQGWKAYNSAWAPYCHFGSKTRFHNPELITHQMFRDARTKFWEVMQTDTVDQTVADYRYAEYVNAGNLANPLSYQTVNQWCAENDKLFPPNYKPPQ